MIFRSQSGCSWCGSPSSCGRELPIEQPRVDVIAVREAAPNDAEAVIDVVRRSITQLCAADHRDDPGTLATWLANKTPQNFLSWLSNPDNFCVVAWQGDRLSGVG